MKTDVTNINFNKFYQRYIEMKEVDSNKVTLAIIAHIPNDDVSTTMSHINKSIKSIHSSVNNDLARSMCSEFIKNTYLNEKSNHIKKLKYDIIVVISGLNSISSIESKRRYHSSLARLKNKYTKFKLIEVNELLTCSEARKLAVLNSKTNLIQFIDHGDLIDILNLTKLINDISDRKFGFLHTSPLFTDDNILKDFGISLYPYQTYKSEFLRMDIKPNHRYHDTEEVQLIESFIKPRHIDRLVYDIPESKTGRKFSTIGYVTKSKSSSGSIPNEVVVRKQLIEGRSSVSGDYSKYIIIISKNIQKKDTVEYAIEYPSLVQTPWNTNLLKLVYEIMDECDLHVNYKEDMITNLLARLILNEGKISCKLYKTPFYYYGMFYNSVTHKQENNNQYDSDDIKVKSAIEKLIGKKSDEVKLD